MNRTEAEALKRIPLTPLRISNGALGAENLPTRLKLLNWGRNESVKGPVLLDDRSVAVFAANQTALGFDRVAIDYEHNTAPGSEAYKESQEPRPVAGYGTPKLLSGDGLYLEDISWTESGKANAKSFADLSPAPRLDQDGRVLFLHSTALCRNGAVYNLSFYSAEAEASNNNDMTPQEIAATINAALQPITAQLTTFATDLKALKEAKPTITVLSTEVDGKVVTLNVGDLITRLGKIDSTLEKLVNGAEDKEKAELISRFSAEGKVPMGEDGKALTVEKLKELPPGVLRLLIASTPATVPLNARGKKPVDGQKRDDLTGSDRAAAEWAHLEK